MRKKARETAVQNIPFVQIHTLGRYMYTVAAKLRKNYLYELLT